MSDHFTVQIHEKGRSGDIRYSEGVFHSHTFYYEFGGGETVVAIYIPTADEWPTALPWAAGRRSEVLDRIATEVRRQRCRGCRAHLSAALLELLEPKPW
jgi:hypothetical protein